MKHAPRPLFLTLVVIVFVGSCSTRPLQYSPATTKLPPRLDSYFESYCDYTGSLGIGFVPSHTYDYRFRQHLKTSRDPELKRLFVLQNLHRDVEYALRDFKAGIVMTGKSSSRPLTLSEWQNTQQNIQTQIDDLAAYTAFTHYAIMSHDPLCPDDPQGEAGSIKRLREDLQSITNSPTTE